MKIACQYVAKNRLTLSFRVDESRRDYSHLCIDIDDYCIAKTYFDPESLRRLASFIEDMEDGLHDNVVSFAAKTKRMTVES